MNGKRVRWMLAAAAVFFFACERNPIEKLVNPIPDGSVPQSSGLFVLYDDELRTGGGLGLIPGGGNQTISLADRSSPQRSTNDIHYAWNGGDVAGQHLFAGFSLLVTPDFTSFANARPKDLSGPGYTKVTLYLRGSLSAGTQIRIEGPDAGPGHTGTPYQSSALSGSWTQISFAVPPADFQRVKVFLTVSFQFTQPAGTTDPGEGGEVFLDDIRYER